MTYGRRPRQLAGALRELRAQTAPQTLLAAVQEAWPAVAGAGIAAVSSPVSERDGVVTIACESATWAQELDLLQSDLVARLNESLSEGSPTPAGIRVRRLRVTADAARFIA